MKQPPPELSAHLPSLDEFTGPRLQEEQLRRQLATLGEAVADLPKLATSPRIARRIASGALHLAEHGILGAGKVSYSQLLPPHDYYFADGLFGTFVASQVVIVQTTPKPPRFRRRKTTEPPIPTTYYMLSQWSDLTQHHTTSLTESSPEPMLHINEQRAALMPALHSFHLGLAAVENEVACFVIKENPHFEKTIPEWRLDYPSHNMGLGEAETLDFGPVDRRRIIAAPLTLDAKLLGTLSEEVMKITTAAQSVPQPEPELKGFKKIVSRFRRT